MTNIQSTILVTGGNGFLGSQVLRVLQEEDKTRQLFIISRREPTLACSVTSAIQCLRFDLENEFALPKGIQMIIHVSVENRGAT